MATEAEKSFFDRALGFGADWQLTGLSLDEGLREAHITLSYIPGTYVGPDGSGYSLYDRLPSRKWQHLPILGYRAFLHCRVPRADFGDGKPKVIPVPWATPRKGYTLLFRDHVTELLLGTYNQSATAKLAGTTPDIVGSVMKDAVGQGLALRDAEGHGPKKLGIDEKAVGKGHQYASVLTDLEAGTVREVIKGRDKDAAKALIDSSLTEGQKLEVEAVALDMWPAFMDAVKEKLPNALHVHDKFHLVQYLNKAIDTVRKKEVRGEGLLKKAKYVMLKGQDNLTGAQWEHFEDIMAANLEAARAWALAEQFKATVPVKGQSTVQATAFFDMWCDKVEEAKLKPMEKVMETFKSHLEGILNYIKQPITNAIAERINGKIQRLKTVSRGYRNFGNLRIAILFFNGGLRLFSH